MIFYFFYKIVNGVYDCPEILRQIYFKVPFRPLRINDLFFIPLHGTNYGKHSPIPRALNSLNRFHDAHIFNDSYWAFRRKIRNESGD